VHHSTNQLEGIMKITNSRFLPVLLISFSLIINGCTLYGFGIGAIVDGIRPYTKVVNREDYKTIEIYREITVIKVDRTVTQGRFIEITEEYLTFETMFGIEIVNRKDIADIATKSKKNGIWYGLGIGFVMDIFLLMMLLDEEVENP